MLSRLSAKRHYPGRSVKVSLKAQKRTLMMVNPIIIIDQSAGWSFGFREVPRGFEEVSERFPRGSERFPRGLREVSERFPRGSERYPRGGLPMVSSKSERFREVSKKSPRGFREVPRGFHHV